MFCACRFPRLRWDELPSATLPLQKKTKSWDYYCLFCWRPKRAGIILVESHLGNISEMTEFMCCETSEKPHEDTTNAPQRQAKKPSCIPLFPPVFNFFGHGPRLTGSNASLLSKTRLTHEAYFSFFTRRRFQGVHTQDPFFDTSKK